MLATRLAADWSRLVCVQGDANAWPRRDPAREPPEIVHWVAHRPATGETYEAVVAPRRPLAPTTPGQVELPAARLCAGHSVETWRRSWRQFSRPDDLVVTWGTFYGDLAAGDGLALAEKPLNLLNLRTEALRLLHVPNQKADRSSPVRPRLRTIDDFAALLGVEAPSLGIEGRAGRRLAALGGVLGVFARGAYPT